MFCLFSPDNCSLSQGTLYAEIVSFVLPKIERKRKTEPWETYSYQHNESPEAGGCAMASGRGINFPIKPLSRSKPVSCVTPTEHDLEKRWVELTGLGTSYPPFTSTVDVLLYQQSLTNYSNYQLAMPLADTSKDHSLSTAVCGKQITSSKNLQYESAIPIGTRINNELTYSSSTVDVLLYFCKDLDNLRSFDLIDVPLLFLDFPDLWPFPWTWISFSICIWLSAGKYRAKAQNRTMGNIQLST
jgi:hypothetical protein